MDGQLRRANENEDVSACALVISGESKRILHGGQRCSNSKSVVQTDSDVEKNMNGEVSRKALAGRAPSASAQSVEERMVTR